MRILIVNGSPRPHGNISRMLRVMEEEARDNGHEVDYVTVHELDIVPCKGCMACRSSLRCVYPEDGAQRTLRLIGKCDAMVVGAPCYWGNIPGQMKVLFDRIVYGMIGESVSGIPRPLHKGKRLILVSASTTPFPFNILFHQSQGAIRALREIFRWSGFKTVGVVQTGGTKKHPVSEKKLRACRKAIHRL